MRSLSDVFNFIAIAFVAFSAWAVCCWRNDVVNWFHDFIPFFVATASNEFCNFSGKAWKAPFSVGLLLLLLFCPVTNNSWWDWGPCCSVLDLSLQHYQGICAHQCTTHPASSKVAFWWIVVCSHSKRCFLFCPRQVVDGKESIIDIIMCWFLWIR